MERLCLVEVKDSSKENPGRVSLFIVCRYTCLAWLSLNRAVDEQKPTSCFSFIAHFLSIWTRGRMLFQANPLHLLRYNGRWGQVPAQDSVARLLLGVYILFDLWPLVSSTALRLNIATTLVVSMLTVTCLFFLGGLYRVIDLVIFQILIQ